MRQMWPRMIGGTEGSLTPNLVYQEIVTYIKVCVPSTQLPSSGKPCAQVFCDMFAVRYGFEDQGYIESIC